MAQTPPQFPKRIRLLLTVILLVGLTALVLVWLNKPSLQDMCESHFKQAASLTKEATTAGNKLLVANSVVSEVIAGGETFLNNCADHDLPLSAQHARLSELSQLAQVIPVEFICAKNYEPVIQLIDLDEDGTDEAILHTRAVRCDGGRLDFGGLSVAFGRDKQTNQWHGTVIWPCFDTGCSWADTWIQSTQPSVQRLNVRDSQGNSFLLVAGGYVGADANHKFLIVWRWDGAHATRTLLLHLHDWCGWPIKWEVTEEGYIVIPATGETSRCEASPTAVYALQGDTYALVEQSKP